MAIIFRRRLKLAKGLYLNLSKGGVSTSVSPFKGLTYSYGKRGTRQTISLPGTGMRWTSSSSNGYSQKVQRPSAADKKALNDRIRALNRQMLEMATPEVGAEEARKHLIPLVTQPVRSMTVEELQSYAKRIDWAKDQYRKVLAGEKVNLRPPRTGMQFRMPLVIKIAAFFFCLWLVGDYVHLQKSATAERAAAHAEQVQAGESVSDSSAIGTA